MFVIFGASGRVGLSTVRELRKGGHPVRAVLRDDRHVHRFVQMGCEVAIADIVDAAAVRSALKGARAVQMLCPFPTADKDPASTMLRTVESVMEALGNCPPPSLLGLSDYGAEIGAEAGLTHVFHQFETELRSLERPLTLVRSAEHMENWARVIPGALASGILPSLHHPVDKPFPVVSAPDVGVITAQLLLGPITRPLAVRVVSVEGPRRVTAREIAASLSDLMKRRIVARELPREQWLESLQRAGLERLHAQLIVDLHALHNAGRIDVEPGISDLRYGTTQCTEAISELLAALAP